MTTGGSPSGEEPAVTRLLGNWPAEHGIFGSAPVFMPAGVRPGARAASISVRPPPDPGLDRSIYSGPSGPRRPQAPRSPVHHRSATFGVASGPPYRWMAALSCLARRGGETPAPPPPLPLHPAPPPTIRPSRSRALSGGCPCPLSRPRLPVINSLAPIRVCDNGGWTDTWFAKHGRVFNIGVYPYVEVQIAVYPERLPAPPLHPPRRELWPALRRLSLQRPPRVAPPPLLEAAIDYMGVPEDLSVTSPSFPRHRPAAPPAPRPPSAWPSSAPSTG